MQGLMRGAEEWAAAHESYLMQVSRAAGFFLEWVNLVGGFFAAGGLGSWMQCVITDIL